MRAYNGQKIQQKAPTGMRPVLVIQHNAHVPPGYVIDALKIHSRYCWLQITCAAPWFSLLSGLLFGRPHVTVQLHENPNALEGMASSIESGAFEFSGIVSLGGSMGAYEDIEWIPVELALMRAAVHAGDDCCGIAVNLEMKCTLHVTVAQTFLFSDCVLVAKCLQQLLVGRFFYHPSRYVPQPCCESCRMQ